jgi:hypothetical protein
MSYVPTAASQDLRGRVSSGHRMSWNLNRPEASSELTRVAARIEMVDQDQFIYHMPGRSNVWSSTGSSSITSSLRPLSLLEQRNPPVQGIHGPSTSSLRSSSVDGGRSNVPREEGTSKFEVIVPLPGHTTIRLAAAATEAGGAQRNIIGGPLTAQEDVVVAETLNVLADQVAQSMVGRGEE